MRHTKLLSWIGLALGAVYLTMVVLVVVLSNLVYERPQDLPSWINLEGLVLGAPFILVPLLAVALLLRSSNSLWRSLAGIFALLVAGYFFLGDVVGTLAGGWQFITSYGNYLAINVPLIAYYVVVSWTTLLHRTAPKAPLTPMTS